MLTPLIVDGHRAVWQAGSQILVADLESRRVVQRIDWQDVLSLRKKQTSTPPKSSSPRCG